MFRSVKNLFAFLGAMLVLIALVPPVWYARWLAGPWTTTQAPYLIVLGGDSIREGMMGETSYWRSLYAVDVWKEGSVRHMILSGDANTTAAMRAWIVGQGVPAGAITVEGRSQTTRENALFTASLLRDAPGPFLLLTSDIHMFRARRAFRKAGLEVQPRPAPDAFKRSNDWRNRWRVVLDIGTECAKILYYKSKGWI